MCFSIIIPVSIYLIILSLKAIDIVLIFFVFFILSNLCNDIIRISGIMDILTSLRFLLILLHLIHFIWKSTISCLKLNSNNSIRENMLLFAGNIKGKSISFLNLYIILPHLQEYLVINWI